MSRKAVFDAARGAGADFNRPGNIGILDSALDALGVPKDGMQAGEDAIMLIREFEGCHKRRSDGMIEAYPDPGSGGDPWTIGWGATGAGIKRGTVWSQAMADARLTADISKFADGVAKALNGAATTQNQMDALVSFSYNVGLGSLQSSTLLKKHKLGDWKGAQAEFSRWSKASGRELPGLVRRRAAEAALYGKAS